MRAALLAYGVLMLTVVRMGPDLMDIGDHNRGIPLFAKIGEVWVCVDRNPAQVGRQDCWPRLPRENQDSRK